MPWTMLFPTLTPVGDLLALNHALWAALSGLGVGVAVMFRHWRWVWPIALAGPLLALSNHVMLNHFAVNVFEAIGRADAPAPYSTIRDLTDGGRLPMVVLVVGVLAVVVAQWLILRWVSKRDRTFPPLPIGHALGLIAHATSRTGAAQVLAADRYLRLRRSVYFAAWRTRTAGGYPDVSDADYAELVSLAARLEILPPYQPSAPPAVASPDAPAEAPAT
jgi:hypothetical protein